MEEEKGGDRVHITLPGDVNDWYRVQAKRYGTSKSAYMAIALSEFKLEKERLEVQARGNSSK